MTGSPHEAPLPEPAIDLGTADLRHEFGSAGAAVVVVRVVVVRVVVVPVRVVVVLVVVVPVTVLVVIVLVVVVAVFVVVFVSVVVCVSVAVPVSVLVVVVVPVVVTVLVVLVVVIVEEIVEVKVVVRVEVKRKGHSSLPSLAVALSLGCMRVVLLICPPWEIASMVISSFASVRSTKPYWSSRPSGSGVPSLVMPPPPPDTTQAVGARKFSLLSGAQTCCKCLWPAMIRSMPCLREKYSQASRPYSGGKWVTTICHSAWDRGKCSCNQ
mmetsp:Transcript_52086/g.169190  ORF Transcript_52086/g.169190 Transcript_52086/m.169190 type:complete len:268 (+) Transcript_52086:689-1492(+)